MKICTADECDREVVARDLCMKHYQRHLRGKPIVLPDKMQCPSCLDEFRPMAAHQRYCTKQCGQNSRTRIRLGYTEPVPGHRKCEYCQADYYVPPGRRRRLRYCTEECRKAAFQAREYRRKHGLSFQDYRAMISAQDNRCAICRLVERDSGRKSMLSLDHDHTTNKVRALLCVRCNSGLGMFMDDPALLRAAADYIEKHRKTVAA